MNQRGPRAKLSFQLIATVLTTLLLGGIASSQVGFRGQENSAGAEFHLVRMIYRTSGGAGSRGIRQPWWAIDYPQAEEHFLPALNRLTNISVTDDSIHLEVTDDRIFEHPFMFLQQPGAGGWYPNETEAARLREYLMRGGFLLVDDFHGESEWAFFAEATNRVLPEFPIVEIPQNDTLMHVFFDLDQRIQIPGERHVRWGMNGDFAASMAGPPHWRGIYDDKGRLMVAINFNMDMGDAWEHADDPYYPVPMTKTAYQLGVNYVIYAMTH
jgi:hypothetical protein